MAMLNRAIFRWGNRGQRFRKGERELPRASSQASKRGAPAAQTGTRQARGLRVRLQRTRAGGQGSGALGSRGARAPSSISSSISWRHQLRVMRDEAQWATAWLLNFGIFFCMCWFSIIYGMQFGKEKSDEWLIGLLQGFWFGVAILEPIEVLALVLLPSLFDNEYIASCRQKAKDLGLV